eukprot:TRINITY_DN45844_c0_g1_i1.p1 TRINITY_DN45844_c0_g1~~TRINITY_DN45844_c0_g1_i1.p1  ORF type:complete len:266 (-),score=52.34 TRINITY_DN45844_c0_g1_i1:30-782(-)
MVSVTNRLQIPQLLLPSRSDLLSPGLPSPWTSVSNCTTTYATPVSSPRPEESRPSQFQPTLKQYLQVCSELDTTKQQLFEEQQRVKMLEGKLMLQEAAYQKEIAALDQTNAQLRADALDLIQDLENTLSSPQPSQWQMDGSEAADALETIKNSFLSRRIAPVQDAEAGLVEVKIPPPCTHVEAAVNLGPGEDKCAREVFAIPSWSHVNRHMQPENSKQDACHDVRSRGSSETRSRAGSLTSISSASSDKS